MSDLQTIELPDVGDVEEVEVIEVLIAEGDSIVPEQSLITVESDKASMEIPASITGTVTSVLVKTGDKVSKGTPILVVDAAGAPADSTADAPAETAADSTGTSPADNNSAATGMALNEAAQATSASDADESYQLVVIGAGPGGYTAAFRAADLGMNVLLIERYPNLGGVCLNVGCIPSKALLHTAQIINETQEMAEHGVTFGKPEIDINKLRGFKENVIGQLTGGLAGLAKQRKVTVAHGIAKFSGSNTLTIEDNGQQKTIGFEKAIIAAGSQSVRIPGLPYDDDRLMDSTGALELADIPKRMLIIGGGIIGLEMGCVYDALGSKVSVVELSDELMPGADRDLVRPLERRLKKRFENILLGTKVSGIEALKKGLKATFTAANGDEAGTETYDRILLAVGRSPNGNKLDAEKAGVLIDERGFISVDKQQKTNVDHIFAIGDIVGQPMLAHKATHEGKTAAEVAAGHKAWFDPLTIPSVAYTDPEVAWMGLTETDAKAQSIPYEKASFPWAASGRALSIARSEGVTKVLYDPETKRILGAGMTGPSAGELIAEAVLALEMGADIEDISLTVHPHPTLSETFNFATEVAAGTCTDIYVPKKS